MNDQQSLEQRARDFLAVQPEGSRHAELDVQRLAAFAAHEREHKPYCDECGLEFTPEEQAVIADLSKRQDLRPAKVIKQALRLYQLHVLGTPNLGEKAAIRSRKDGDLMPTEMDEKRLQQIERLVEAATPHLFIRTAGMPRVDAELLGSARTNLKDLCTALRERQTRIAALEQQQAEAYALEAHDQELVGKYMADAEAAEGKLAAVKAELRYVIEELRPTV